MNLTPLSAPLAASQFSYAGVVIGFKVHLICTYVMTVWCRHDAVALSRQQFGDTTPPKRPLPWTANRHSGYPTRAMAALYLCFKVGKNSRAENKNEPFIPCSDALRGGTRLVLRSAFQSSGLGRIAPAAPWTAMLPDVAAQARQCGLRIPGPRRHGPRPRSHSGGAARRIRLR